LSETCRSGREAAKGWVNSRANARSYKGCWTAGGRITPRTGCCTMELLDMNDEELRDLEKAVKKAKRIASERASELHDLVEDRLPAAYQEIPMVARAHRLVLKPSTRCPCEVCRTVSSRDAAIEPTGRCLRRVLRTSHGRHGLKILRMSPGYLRCLSGLGRGPGQARGGHGRLGDIMSDIITGLTRGGASWTPAFVLALNQPCRSGRQGANQSRFGTDRGLSPAPTVGSGCHAC